MSSGEPDKVHARLFSSPDRTMRLWTSTDRGVAMSDAHIPSVKENLWATGEAFALSLVAAAVLMLVWRAAF
jgi:hypothetical protein